MLMSNSSDICAAICRKDPPRMARNLPPGMGKLFCSQSSSISSLCDGRPLFVPILPCALWINFCRSHNARAFVHIRSGISNFKTSLTKLQLKHVKNCNKLVRKARFSWKEGEICISVNHLQRIGNAIKNGICLRNREPRHVLSRF